MESHQRRMHFEGRVGIVAILVPFRGTVADRRVADALPLGERDSAMPGADGALVENLLARQRNDGDEKNREPQPRFVVLKFCRPVAVLADAVERLQVRLPVITGPDSVDTCGHSARRPCKNNANSITASDVPAAGRYARSRIGECCTRYWGRPAGSTSVVVSGLIPRLRYNVAKISWKCTGRSLACSPSRFVEPITCPLRIPPPASSAQLTAGQ